MAGAFYKLLILPESCLEINNHRKLLGQMLRECIFFIFSSSLMFLLLYIMKLRSGKLNFFFFFIFLGPHQQHMEVPRLGVKQEL